MIALTGFYAFCYRGGLPRLIQLMTAPTMCHIFVLYFPPMFIWSSHNVYMMPSMHASIGDARCIAMGHRSLWLRGADVQRSWDNKQRSRVFSWKFCTIHSWFIWLSHWYMSANTVSTLGHMRPKFPQICYIYGEISCCSWFLLVWHKFLLVQCKCCCVSYTIRYVGLCTPILCKQIWVLKPICGF